MLTIRRLIEAKKAEREENGEAGFSLIELIIVVVILGILVAIAIPVFGNIQNEARISAAKAAAANAAAQWTSQLGADETLTAYDTDDADLVVTPNPPAFTDVADVCATATNATITGGTTAYTAGPGC
ncbi:prepilin-type N-terminal cleavage/methylation domain-containing protein [Microbacterium sp. NPDC089318]